MRALSLAVALLAATLPGGAQAAKKCPPDSVASGATCIDRYEASIWSVPGPTTTHKGLVKKIQKGTVKLADLERAQAVPLGCDEMDQPDFPASFPPDGGWEPLAGTDPPTPGIYAVSLAGVVPSGCATWFQADQACALSGKHLPTNQEWQRAVTGTVDPAQDDHFTTCNVGSGSARPAGSRASCVSQFGAFDMVGNLAEWTAEWADLQTGECRVSFADDELCFGGDGTLALPGARLRGGSATDGRDGGAFALSSALGPDLAQPRVGFRCAR